MTNTIPFGPNDAVAKFGHTEGGQSRVAVLRVPGLAMGVELIEYKDIERTPQRPHFCRSRRRQHGVPRSRISMRCSRKSQKYPGVTVLTAGGKPRTITTPNGVLHAVFVQDPDGFVVEMLDAAKPPRRCACRQRRRRQRLRSRRCATATDREVLQRAARLQLRLGAAFNDNQDMASTAGAPGRASGRAGAQFPGTAVPFTLIEFKNIPRKELSGRTQDPGTTVLQLIVRDVTALTAK